MSKSLIVWRFSDEKPGHVKQTDGLLQGLRQICDVRSYDIKVGDSASISVSQRISECEHPDLVIGAGHATHIPMICSRVRFECKAVVLMKPSVPSSWFDMVLVPQHDRAFSHCNLERTEIALCPVVTGVPKEHDLGVILIGGESRHYDCDEDSLGRAIAHIVSTQEDVRWEIFDSRRTPDGFLNRLDIPDSVIRNHHEVIPTDFLSNCLARSSIGWVTCDSVSMVHEAIANGLQVGVIDMPLKNKRRKNKIQHAVDALIAQGLASRELSLPMKGAYRKLVKEDYNLKYARLICDRLL